MKLGRIDKAMGAAIAVSLFTMMESTSHAVSSVISAAFNASASPEGRILAAGIALSSVAIEGYAAFLARSGQPSDVPSATFLTRVSVARRRRLRGN